MDILNTIKEQQIYPSSDLEKYFWRMFVADAFLGNFDRHNGNWGFLINYDTGEVKLSPVYDCGSCLYPQIDEKKMDEVMKNISKIEERIYIFPTSAIKNNNKKINYFQFLMETEDENCIEALSYISKKINLDAINEFIDSITNELVSEKNKKFLKFFINERKEKIIDKALEQHTILKPDIEMKEYDNEDFNINLF